MKYLIGLTALLIFSYSTLNAQQERWQQRAEYKMDIIMDVEADQYAGTQKLVYTNNSNERLDQVFYHLFFNAFQPGSMMDVRSRTIVDPDSRVGSRINKLSAEEQGYIKVKTLAMNGEELKFKTIGTILEVTLNKPIEPYSTVIFDMTWDAQIPVQIRRSGRDNKEGIDYTMTQWYPRMCEYDYEGWHANDYIGREFHGTWGDYDVNITIPAKYMLGFTGVLKNAGSIGKGYIPQNIVPKGENLTWQISAKNVIDFAWAADPDFVHESVETDRGTVLHFLYQDSPEYGQNWKDLQGKMVSAFEYMNHNFGEYPYPQYSFIQGGDGGMEYPMCTMITGNRTLPSLVGVSIHEGMHSWYQGILASNESLYEWMDEGFTSYATAKTYNYLFPTDDPLHKSAYQGYFYSINQGIQEPLITPADHYKTNTGYGIAAYNKGQTLIAQLEYVIGKQNVEDGLLTYFDTWKFKHPNPTDFKRVMEKQSGLELDWYFNEFTQTTDTIDYAIEHLASKGKITELKIVNQGSMPMPLDVEVVYKDGTKEMYYIPLRMMRGEKPNDYTNGERILMDDWPWTNPYYIVLLPSKLSKIISISIDPNHQMAELHKKDNTYDKETGEHLILKDRNRKSPEDANRY